MQSPDWQLHLDVTVAELEGMAACGVYNVMASERLGVDHDDLVTWEQRNPGLDLPPDVKSFLMSSDGFELSWHARHGDDLLPIGSMRMNSLSEMTPVPKEALQNEYGETCEELPPPLPTGLQAFDLDAKCSYGRVCLLATGGRGDSARAQVWFQDLGCTWVFVANSFTDYFRLMLTHYGLPHWQYAFTSAGLDPIAKQWFRVVAPSRLAIDTDGAAAVGASTCAAPPLATAAPSKGGPSEPGAHQPGERSRPGTATGAGGGIVRRGRSAVRRKSSASTSASRTAAQPSQAGGARRGAFKVEEEE